MKKYKNILHIVHHEGYIFIVSFVMATLILATFSHKLCVFGIFCTILCVFFFRNPDRIVPLNDDFIISPADGIIQKIVNIQPPQELGLDNSMMTRVSIFLNVFNVHVNRIPVSGKIVALKYNPGKFFNASLDKSSIYNERQSIVIKTADKGHIVITQIAGFIARRIVCYPENGDNVCIGERFGIIRFGSRVDLYLPPNVDVIVSEGQTCVGGETVIASFIGNDTKRNFIRI